MVDPGHNLLSLFWSTADSIHKGSEGKTTNSIAVTNVPERLPWLRVGVLPQVRQSYPEYLKTTQVALTYSTVR